MTVRTDFLSRGTTGSSILDHDFGHLCFGRRIQISGHSVFGILITLMHLPFRPAYKRVLHQLLALNMLEALKNCPWPLRLSFEMLMILVQWTLHTNQTHLLQCHLGVRPCLCTFWYWNSSSKFLRWQMSINDAKWTLLPLFFASSITSFLFLTFVSCHARIFSSFSHSFSTAAFASVIFINWGIGMNLRTRL